jgi:pimeloyl-ACP methyl ester carboxylesterase
MKLFFLCLIGLYVLVLAYVYLTQTSKIFNPDAIENKEEFTLEDTKQISLEVKNGLFIRGVYKKSKKQNAPLIIYFGGNADDATRIVLKLNNINDFDIVAFNYRGFVNSDGKPSQTALFSDAIKIYDEFAKDKDIVIIGRSLGTGVASYLASKREVKGVILITPYDSIVSIGKRKYPFLPIELLAKHKFESTKYLQKVLTPIALIEVFDDQTIPKYHFDRLKKSVQNLALHVELKDTTHADVLNHPDFEKVIRQMLKRFGF